MTEYSEQPLKIKIGSQEFVAVDYCWENQDFIFVTENGEEYRFANAYPISIKIDGLDYNYSEEVTIELTKKYETTHN